MMPIISAAVTEQEARNFFRQLCRSRDLDAADGRPQKGVNFFDHYEITDQKKY